MGNLSKLLADVKTEEVSVEVLKSSGTSFINDNGVYVTTISNAFITQTKKGGLALNIFFKGENSMDTVLYIASKRKGEVTTNMTNGKPLEAYKQFIQLMYLATGELKDIHEIETKEETIKYKAYGKDVKVQGEVVTALVGLDLQIGVRLSESYNYEDGETDKTSLRTDNNGDVAYGKDLDSIFSKEGFSAGELMSGKEVASDIESKIKFLSSDKATKRVKLEAPEVDENEIEEIEEDSILF